MTRVPIDDFERRYRAATDPWQFATSSYEQRRYDVTMACLPAGRFRRTFEPGCSIGELTRRLADRSDLVVAWDGSPSVVAEARSRLASRSNVEFDVRAIPDQWPPGRFDLVVLSEIGYYFDEPALGQVASQSATTLDAGGTLMAVHWLGVSADHVLHGDDVHSVLERRTGLEHGGMYRDGGFRLDWWCKR